MVNPENVLAGTQAVPSGAYHAGATCAAEKKLDHQSDLWHDPDKGSRAFSANQIMDCKVRGRVESVFEPLCLWEILWRRN